eukprot:6153817-Amphidinium_carterae.1
MELLDTSSVRIGNVVIGDFAGQNFENGTSYVMILRPQVPGSKTRSFSSRSTTCLLPEEVAAELPLANE